MIDAREMLEESDESLLAFALGKVPTSFEEAVEALSEALDDALEGRTDSEVEPHCVSVWLDEYTEIGVLADGGLGVIFETTLPAFGADEHGNIIDDDSVYFGRMFYGHIDVHVMLSFNILAMRLQEIQRDADTKDP